MDTAQLLSLLPFAVGIACAVAMYLKTHKGCDKTIGKIPLAGKVCGTKFAKVVLAVVAIMCGCCGLMTLRAVLGQ